MIQMFAKLDKTMNDLAAQSRLTKKEEKELRDRLNYRFNYSVRDIHFAENLVDPRYCGKIKRMKCLHVYTHAYQI